MKTKLLACLLLTGLFAACDKAPRQPAAADLYAEAMKELQAAKTPDDRFVRLNAAIKEAVNAGKDAEAMAFIEEQAGLLAQYKDNWNYGNAVQDINQGLGRLALRAGRVEEAEKYLLESARHKGSPQLLSYGPNMRLAQELLEKGRKDAVLKYFELCGKFWSLDKGRLKWWAEEVRAGKSPDFGGNLDY